MSWAVYWVARGVPWSVLWELVCIAASPARARRSHGEEREAHEGRARGRAPRREDAEGAEQGGPQLGVCNGVTVF